ncbi:MAG: M23 family metallopeptidase [Thermodesulfobacteriota bacterium]|nr:M23 family metallopeptidase [Thermodesulfobacteriota bacterium]
MKEFSLSTAWVGLIACGVFFVVAGILFIVNDYVRLKKGAPSRAVLAKEVTEQRAQIQVFAKKIQRLNEELMTLRELERKIRIIADVNDPSDKNAVFGVGGAIPRDLDTTRSLADRHDSLVRDMHAGADYLDEAFMSEQQAFEELHAYLHDQRSLLASTPSIRPTTGWVSSGFGHRTSPFTGLKEFHRGIDIATEKGKPILAPADGIVTFAGFNGGLGRTLVLDHEHGVITRYAHLNECLVKPGERVDRGDKIGLVGNSGRSTGPHLHYEVHLNGIPVDPANYILN